MKNLPTAKPTRKLKVGDVVEIAYGRDDAGQHWWVARSDPTALHGPFRSEAEALKDSRSAMFGPDCTIKECGQWDPAWSRPQ